MKSRGRLKIPSDTASSPSAPEPWKPSREPKSETGENGDWIARSESVRERALSCPLFFNLVVNHKGEPYSQYNSYSRLLKRAMRKWNPDLDIAPKDWRNVVITHAKLNNYDGSFLECYVGHSPRSISEKHYFPRLTGIQIHSRGQEQALKKVKEVFTEHVVKYLEEDMRGYYGEDTTPKSDATKTPLPLTPMRCSRIV